MIGQQVTGSQGHQFTITKEIGQGGFGIVYLAKDKKGQLYALKVIAPLIDPAVGLSFKQEIESTLGLLHENLLSIIDYGTCTVARQNGLFAVSEYCPDGDYRSSLRSYPTDQARIDKVIGDIRQILTGLTVLHSKIIHRDIKPENILVAGGTLKIGDFGLAKFVDEATRTLTFKGAGTPRYMAPEVWLRQHVSKATDLYAVGVMFFEAITGQPPFSGSDADDLRNQHLYSPPPRVRTINPKIPGPIDGIIRKLLKKEPRERYQEAGEVLKVLGHMPGPSNPDVEKLAARMRHHHDAEEKSRLEREQKAQVQQDSESKNRYKEKELLDLINEVVAEINAHLQEIQIEPCNRRGERGYQLGNRSLHIHFFRPGELYQNPEVPGLMDVLKQRHVVHGGYIEIKEKGEDREGWNLVLIRPPGSMYGEWWIVETRISPISGRRTPYEPIATEERLFAKNLGYHWSPGMHTFVLTDKPLERDDILQILNIFIPSS